MKTKTFILIIFLFLSFRISFAQNEQTSFGISFSGFVKTDAFFDSRQTIGLREGHFLLYPANEFWDKDKNDINAKANFNILSIQTRLIGKITGPDAIGAKTSGLIEGEFFGTSDGDANGFRLRHAFVKLDWTSTSLLVGQTWHPMFVAEVFPGVVSFNTGVPFQPFSRNPQIKLSHSLGNLKIILAAVSQRDFTSNGPSGLSSSYLRNSIIPNMHLQFQYKAGEHLFGAGIDYKKLTPRLVTTKNIKTDAAVSGISAIGYFKLSLNPLTIKAEGVLGDNIADLMQLGGYAIKSLDTTKGIEEYTTLKSLSVWGDISYGKDIEFGLFAGYSKNLGSKDNLLGTTYYTRIGNGNIDNLVRVSPRIQLNFAKLRLAAEFEYTSAAYGTINNNNKGKVENTKTISNSRLLFAALYFF
jgi:hypothetical protein